jgi:hypothetical protein
MKLFLRIEYDIASHVHVEQLNCIAINFELKLKNSSGFEFDLKSKEILEIFI